MFIAYILFNMNYHNIFRAFVSPHNQLTLSVYLLNDFYDLQPFSISNTAITRYLAGGWEINTEEVDKKKEV